MARGTSSNRAFLSIKIAGSPMNWQVAVVLLAFPWVQQPQGGVAGADCSSQAFQESYNLGAHELGLGNAAAAVPYLEKAHGVCASSYPASRDLLAAYIQAGLATQARALAQTMMRTHDTAEIHTLLGELETSGGDIHAAAAEYQQAAQLDPTEDNIFNFGTSLLKFQGDSALKIFRYGTAKYPDSEKLHLGLGSALYAQGLTDEAVAEMYKASEINPADPHAMEMLGEMEHIPPAMAPQILARFAAFRRQYPGNAKLTYCYAMAISGRWSNQATADPAEIISLLKQATVIDPSFADAYFQLGEFYQEQGQSDQALHAYQEADRLKPHQQKYLYRLALAYKRAGNMAKFNDAMQAYRDAHANDR
jgi:tetratricopeptide (TPR) repeat protein